MGTGLTILQVVTPLLLFNGDRATRTDVSIDPYQLSIIKITMACSGNPGSFVAVTRIDDGQSEGDLIASAPLMLRLTLNS